MNERWHFDDEAMRIEQLEDEPRREVLSAYLDDELSPAAARHVTAWLDDHPDALRQVEHDRRVWDLLDLYEDEPVPQGFAARTLSRLGLAGTGGKVIQLRPPALAAAAVLLVALGAFLFWSFGRAVGPAAPPEREAEVADLSVPVEYLAEDVDLLLSLSDEGFQAYLVQDLEDPGEDG